MNVQSLKSKLGKSVVSNTLPVYVEKDEELYESTIEITPGGIVIKSLEKVELPSMDKVEVTVSTELEDETENEEDNE